MEKTIYVVVTDEGDCLVAFTDEKKALDYVMANPKAYTIDEVTLHE